MAAAAVLVASAFVSASFIADPALAMLCSSLSMSLPLMLRSSCIARSSVSTCSPCREAYPPRRRCQKSTRSEAVPPRDARVPELRDHPRCTREGTPHTSHRTSLSVAAGESRGRRQAIPSSACLAPTALTATWPRNPRDLLSLAYFRARRETAQLRQPRKARAVTLSTSPPSASPWPPTLPAETGEGKGQAFATSATRGSSMPQSLRCVSRTSDTSRCRATDPRREDIVRRESDR